MKITCQGCSQENELGRIFCANCGKKLDLTMMSINQVSKGSRLQPIVAVVKVLLAVLLLAAVAAGVLAFWPRDPFHEGTVRAGANRVKSQLDGVRSALDAGAETTVTLAARDVNAYLEAYRARANLVSLSLEVTRGFMVIRATDRLGPWELAGFELGPIGYSYEVRCVPDGQGFRMSGAALGRLPLPGPLALPVQRRITSLFEVATLEKRIMAKLDLVKFETDLIEAAFSP